MKTMPRKCENCQAKEAMLTDDANASLWCSWHRNPCAEEKNPGDTICWLPDGSTCWCGEPGTDRYMDGIYGGAYCDSCWEARRGKELHRSWIRAHHERIAFQQMQMALQA
jgi:hypothetical protein